MGYLEGFFYRGGPNLTDIISKAEESESMAEESESMAEESESMTEEYESMWKKKKQN